MIKYNYKGAAALWDEFFDLCIFCFAHSEADIQHARRAFMRALTRGADTTLYIDFVKETLEQLTPANGAKYKQLIDDIISFKGVLE